MLLSNNDNNMNFEKLMFLVYYFMQQVGSRFKSFFCRPIYYVSPRLTLARIGTVVPIYIPIG